MFKEISRHWNLRLIVSICLMAGLILPAPAAALADAGQPASAQGLKAAEVTGLFSGASDTAGTDDPTDPAGTKSGGAADGTNNAGSAAGTAGTTGTDGASGPNAAGGSDGTAGTGDANGSNGTNGNGGTGDANGAGGTNGNGDADDPNGTGGQAGAGGTTDPTDPNTTTDPTTTDPTDPTDPTGPEEPDQPDDLELPEEDPPAPVIVSITRRGSLTLVSWSEEEPVSGFEIQYASNRFFINAKGIDIPEPDQLQCQIIERSSDACKYIRIRAIRQTDTDLYASGWTHSKEVKTTMSGTLTAFMSGSSKLELRSLARQDIRGYDTIQGACYGKGFMYYILWNRDKDKCRIAKMNFSTRQVVRVSEDLPLYHGNDMTFNTRTGRLIVSHARPDRKRLSVIDAGTLKIIATKTINLPSDLPGIKPKRLREHGGYNGFNTIAYNEQRDQYVIQIYGTRDFVYLDSNFRPIRYQRLYKWARQVYQTMDTVGDYVVIANSYESGKPYNVLSVYDWNGKYLSQIKLNKGMELEAILHDGSGFYLTYYHKDYIPYYKTVTKKKTVKKKVKVRVIKKKIKIKKGKNKGKYKIIYKKKKIKKGKNKGKYRYVYKYKTKKYKVKYKVRVKDWKLDRSNYLYRLSGI